MARMCRGIYDLSAAHEGSLSVRQGETFLFLNEANSDNPYWWYVVNGLGEMGYVPKSYVDFEEVSNECLVHEIDDLLDLLHRNPNPTAKNRNLLKALAKARSSFGKGSIPPEPVKRKAAAPPPPPLAETTLNGLTSATNYIPIITDSQAPSNLCSSQSFKENNCFNHISQVLLPVVLENSNEQHSADVLNSNPPFEITSVDTGIDKTDETDSQETIECEIKRDSFVEEVGSVAMSPEACLDAGVQTFEAELTLPPILVPELVDQVRSHTHLSYKMSILAVSTVVETLQHHLPHLTELGTSILRELAELKTKGNSNQVFESRDRERLLSIFHRLWSCKEDAQQRSWPLQEDEAIILDHLSQVKQLLVDADPRVCRDVIQLENYECVHTLVTYFQMETRRCLRLAVLAVLELMCCLDLKVIEQLLSSVLPTELILDILNHPTDIERFMVSARLITCVFSTGQSPPRSVYAHLNVSFATCVLDQLESLLDGRVDEEVANLDLCILLSVNLHLLQPEENFVLEAVRIRSCTPAALTEKLMLLINREEDPVSLMSTANGGLQVPNSVLKFLLDLFHEPVCAQHFYVNDVKVMLDIIVRQLTDLPASVKRRLDYLKLARYILINTCYAEHKHQRSGLAFCLEWLLEHEEFSQEEKSFAHILISEFPHLFTFA